MTRLIGKCSWNSAPRWKEVSGEEGKANDPVRGSSRPAELCHLPSGCWCSAPERPAQPGLPSTTLPPHPPLHAQILTLLLWLCSCRDGHPSQGDLGVHPDPWRNDDRAQLIPHLPSKTACLWPRAESQRVVLSRTKAQLKVQTDPVLPRAKAPHLDSALDHAPQRRCAAAAPASRVLHRERTDQHSAKRFPKSFRNSEKTGQKCFLPKKKNQLIQSQPCKRPCSPVLGQTSRRQLISRLRTPHRVLRGAGACALSAPWHQRQRETNLLRKQAL